MLFIPPGIPHMVPVPEAEASSHTGDGVLCHVDISWTPNPPTAGQTATFTGKLVEEVNGTCSSSNPPLAGKEVAPNLSALVGNQSHQAFAPPGVPAGSLGLPVTNSAGVWTGAVTFDDDNDGNWQLIVFFGGDSTHAPRSTHAQTGSFINFTVAAGDTTPPVVTVPASWTNSTSSASGMLQSFEVHATDDVDGYIQWPQYPSCSPIYGEEVFHWHLFPIGTTTVTCTATDAAGNVGSASFTVTINQTAAPQAELTMNSPNISEFITNTGEHKVRYNPTGSFNFDDFPEDQSCLSVQVLKPDGTQASIDYDTACVQHHEYNYNFQGYISDAFNASGWTMKICSIGYNICVEQNFTINFAFLDADTTPPVIEISPNYTIIAGSYDNQHPWGDGIMVNWDETQQLAKLLSPPYTYAPFYATDNVGVVMTECTVPPSGTPIEGAAHIGFPVGVTTVTCTATDAAGNSSSGTFTITIIAPAADTTPPVFTSVPYEGAPGDGIVRPYHEVTVNGIIQQPEHAAFGMTPGSIQAIDDNGDYIPAFCDAPAVFSNLPAHLVFTSQSGSWPIGVTTVTCYATDAAGNVGTASFPITLTVPGVDTTPPVVTVPANLTFEARSYTAAPGSYSETGVDGVHVSWMPESQTIQFLTPISYVFPWTYSDNVGVVTNECRVDAGLLLHVYHFPVGTTTVECTATDAAGNVGTGTFTVTVTAPAAADTTPPVVTVPSVMYVTAASPGQPFSIDNHAISATDNVDGTVDVNCTAPNTGFNLNGINPATVTCTATDAAGNTGSASYNVNILIVSSEMYSDTTPPTITVPDDIIVYAIGGDSTTHVSQPTPITATDNVGVTSTDANGNIGPVCSADWSWHESHSSNDFSTASWTVPAVPLGTTTIICTAKDGPTVANVPDSQIVTYFGTPARNTASASFTITVVESSADTNPPTIFTPSNFSNSGSITNATSGIEFTNYTYYLPLAYDALDGYIWNVTCTPASGSTFPLGTTTITCTATDAAGNVGTGTFTVIITAPGADITPPVVTVPASWTNSTSSASGLWQSFEIAAYDLVFDTLDNVMTCSPHVTSEGDQSYLYSPDYSIYYSYTFPIGSTTVTCTVSDPAGNQTTESFTVTITEFGDTTQHYTVYVNQMRGAGVVAADENGGCETTTPKSCYSPTSLTINEGDSVTWVNMDPNNWYTLVANTFASTNGAWGGLSQGSGNDNACDGPGKFNDDMCGIPGYDRTSWTHTFDQVGSYYYYDWIYESNSALRPEGVVHVVASGAPPPSAQLPVVTTQMTHHPQSCNINTNASCNAGIDTTPPTITASAIVNATSPTGRTLTLNADWSGPGSASYTYMSGYHLFPDVSIGRDFDGGPPGTAMSLWDLFEHLDTFAYPCGPSGDHSMCDQFQWSIPTDWAAGTYDLTLNQSNDPADAIAQVTIPALSGADVGGWSVSASANSVNLPPLGTNPGSLLQISITNNDEFYDDVIEVALDLIDPNGNHLEHRDYDKVGFSCNTTNVLRCNIPAEGWSTGETKNVSIRTDELDPYVTQGTYTWNIWIEKPNQVLVDTTATFTIGPPGADITPPVLTMPASWTNSTSSASGLWQSAEITSSEGNFNLTCSPMTPSDYGSMAYGEYVGIDAVFQQSFHYTFPIGSTTVTCTATDDAGNVGLGSFTVTINHAVTVTNAFGSETPGCEETNSCFTPSTVTIPVGSTVVWENNYVNGGHTATGGSAANGPSGVFDSSLIMTGESFSHTFEEAGTFDYFCMVHPWMQGTVIVGTGGPVETEVIVDFTAPTLVVSNDMYVQTTDQAGRFVSFATPSATDASGISTLSCNPASGTFFHVGTTVVFCNATDNAGNSELKTFIIEVIYALTDDVPPIFTPISDVIIPTTDAAGMVYDYAMPSVSDNIAVTEGPTCNIPSGSVLPVGNTIIICTATDAHGNTGTTNFTVTVVNTAAVGDIEAPNFVPVQNVFQNATAVNGDIVEFVTPDATDNEGITYGPVCSPPSGSFFTIGDTLVNCIAIDQAGNQGTTFFTVSVLPGEVPLVEDITTLETSQVTVQDLLVEGGDTEPGISAGELGLFNTAVSSDTTQTALVAVYVEDEDAIPLGVGYFKSILGAGDSELTLGFQIPEDAVSGIANVYVNVYTDWPHLGGVSITDEITANVEIMGVEPPDLGAFDYQFDPLPNVYSTDPGFTAGNIIDDSITYWKGSPPVDTFNTWSIAFEGGVNSYADSFILEDYRIQSGQGDDFVTGLQFTEVDYYEANLNVYWVKEYGSLLGIAPISDYRDLLVDDIFIGLGDSNCESSPGEWQPFSREFVTHVTKHEMGHVIGFAHDTDPNSLMYDTAQMTEYGTVETTTTLTEGYAQFIPICPSRAETNYNYHVSIESDNPDELGIDVHFVHSIAEFDNAVAGAPYEFYPGCSHENMLSVTASCNNVEFSGGLMISMPNQTTGLSDVTIKLQENLDGTKTISNVPPVSEQVPIIPTALQQSVENLFEESVEVGEDYLFLNGTEHVELLTEVITADVDKFTIGGWIEPDFSKGGHEFSIVSKENSFNLYLLKESFVNEGGATVIIPNRTLNLELFDGEKWYSIMGNTKLPENWKHTAFVVDGSKAMLYLDGNLEGEVKLEKKLILQCPKADCMVDSKMTISDSGILVGAKAAQAFGIAGTSVDGYHTVISDHFSGVIASIEVFPAAFTGEQVMELYNQEKNNYQRNTIQTYESPTLSDDECLNLVNERGLAGKIKSNTTVICGFPFDVTISLNGSILWVETLPLDDGPYHSIRSVDDLFRTGIAPFASIDFDESLFSYGVYEYVDELDKSLTGKITVFKPTNTVEMLKDNTNIGCEATYSCYEPFVAQINVRDTMIWKNLDMYYHTVTSTLPNDSFKFFDSGGMKGETLFSHQFLFEGTYDYFCTVHPWMQGKIIVGDV